jgi:hypothetical protein
VGRLIKQEIRPRVQQAAWRLTAAWLKTNRTQTQFRPQVGYLICA